MVCASAILVDFGIVLYGMVSGDPVAAVLVGAGPSNGGTDLTASSRA